MSYEPLGQRVSNYVYVSEINNIRDRDVCKEAENASVKQV